MNNIVKRLEKVSSFLDSIGEKELSKNVGNISSNVLRVVEAQYVGIQGYWIRNSRCWPNCYRVKRAKSPELSSQEVWQKCHEEYVESVKGNNETWDKYADNKSDMIKKFANVGLMDVLSEVLDIERRSFDKALNKNISSGMPIGMAIDESINDCVRKYEKEIIAEADSLMKVAVSLDIAGYKKVASELGSISADIVKEAGLWERTKNFFGGGSAKTVNQSLSDLRSTFGKYYQDLQTMMSASSGDPVTQKDQLSQWAKVNMQPLMGAVTKTKDVIADSLAKGPDKATANTGKQVLAFLTKWLESFSRKASVSHIQVMYNQLNNAIAKLPMQDFQQRPSQPEQKQTVSPASATNTSVGNDPAGGPSATAPATAPAMQPNEIGSYIAKLYDMNDLTSLQNIYNEVSNAIKAITSGQKDQSPTAEDQSSLQQLFPEQYAKVFNQRKIKLAKNKKEKRTF